jgi:hypothetical protein
MSMAVSMDHDDGTCAASRHRKPTANVLREGVLICVGLTAVVVAMAGWLYLLGSPGDDPPGVAFCCRLPNFPS